jgi:hypothetical protein
MQRITAIGSRSETCNLQPRKLYVEKRPKFTRRQETSLRSTRSTNQQVLIGGS